MMEHLRHMSNRERLAVIETATRLIRQDLASDGDRDARARVKARELQSLYAPGGEMTEWTALDSEEVIDDSGAR